MVTLQHINGVFIEDSERGTGATLEINHTKEAKKVAKLSFTKGTGLILKRTAIRQANSICATGYTLKNGSMVGEGAELIVEDDGESVTEAHLRPGHSYNATS